MTDQKIDFIIVSRRDVDRMKTMFTNVAENPELWMPHHFIVVYDTPEMAAELKQWMREMMDIMPLPHITVCVARPGSMGHISALREQGLAQGNNPYVYFQDDDDPLPEHLDHCLTILNESDISVVYGAAESRNSRGQVIESLPYLSNDHFLLSPYKAIRYMPTYIHPLAGLFKRTVFDKVPLNDGHRYNRGGAHAFVVRMVQKEVKMTFIPEVIRVRNLHEDNHSPILDLRAQKELAQDILFWAKDIETEELQEFQRNIAHELNAGNIATMREISALVDFKIEEDALSAR